VLESEAQTGEETNQDSASTWKSFYLKTHSFPGSLAEESKRAGIDRIQNTDRNEGARPRLMVRQKGL